MRVGKVCSLSESVEIGTGLGGEMSMEDGVLLCDCARSSESISEREREREMRGKSGKEKERERERRGGDCRVEWR